MHRNAAHTASQHSSTRSSCEHWAHIDCHSRGLDVYFLGIGPTRSCARLNPPDLCVSPVAVIPGETRRVRRVRPTAPSSPHRLILPKISYTVCLLCFKGTIFNPVRSIDPAAPSPRRAHFSHLVWNPRPLPGNKTDSHVYHDATALDNNNTRQSDERGSQRGAYETRPDAPLLYHQADDARTTMMR